MSEPERFNIHGRPWTATAADVKARWCGGKPGEFFRCAWCGHRFAVGDTVRCVYTNGGGEETRGIGGNPFICAACDGPREVILARLRELAAELRSERFWWILRRLGR
jgi:hypothetical protein